MSSPEAGKQVIFNDLEGLKRVWDNSESIRNRLRQFQRLIVEKKRGCEAEAPAGAVAKTNENARANEEVLRPLLKKVAVAGLNAVPCIDALQDEILKMHKANGFQPTAAIVSDEAWSFRYLLSLVKSLTYKEKPPKVSWLKKKAEAAHSEDLASSLASKSSSSSSLGSEMDLVQTLPLETAPEILPADQEVCPKGLAEQKPEGMPIETVARPLVGVDKSPVLAAAAAELAKDAQGALQPEKSEEFRRQQLNMRSVQKDLQESERVAAKEAKQLKPKAAPKPRGRPRKTDAEPACEKPAKKRKSSKATAAATEANSENKAVLEASVADGGKKRVGAEAVAATEVAGGKRRRRANKGDSNPDVDQTLVPEILKVMDRFKRQNYDKENDTWHEQ
eukprot:s303_g5.t1